MLDARSLLQAVKAFRRTAVRLDKGPVALIDVSGDEARGFGLGAGDDQGRHAQVSAARRAADRLRSCCDVGIRTLPPRWPHFFSEAS